MTQELAVNKTKQVAAQISKAATIAGVPLTPDAIAIMAMEVSRILTERYPFMPMDEFEKVLRSGVIGDYGESYLCVKNINLWLRAYYSEKTRINHLNQKKDEANAAMSITEKAGFLVSNIDKMPFLKKFLNRY